MIVPGQLQLYSHTMAVTTKCHYKALILVPNRRGFAPAATFGWEQSQKSENEVETQLSVQFLAVVLGWSSESESASGQGSLGLKACVWEEGCRARDSSESPTHALIAVCTIAMKAQSPLLLSILQIWAHTSWESCSSLESTPEKILPIKKDHSRPLYHFPPRSYTAMRSPSKARHYPVSSSPPKSGLCR